MGLMHAVYYRACDGSQPVRDFGQTLQPMAAHVVVENQIDRLNLLPRTARRCPSLTRRR